jgi:hypothetical protein
MSSENHLTPHFLHGGGEHLESGETSHMLEVARENYAHQQKRQAAARDTHADTRERASGAVAESKKNASTAVKQAQAAPKSDHRIVDATKARKVAENEARHAQNVHGKNLSAHRAKRVEIEQQHDVIKAAKKEHGKASDEHKGAKSDLKRLHKDYKKTGRAVHASAVAGPVVAATLRDARTKERGHKERAADNVTAVRNKEAQRHEDVTKRAKIATSHDAKTVRQMGKETKVAAGHVKALRGIHQQVKTLEREHTKAAREHASAADKVARTRAVHEKEMRGRLSKVSGHLVKLIGHGLKKSAEAPKIDHSVQNRARL